MNISFNFPKQTDLCDMHDITSTTKHLLSCHLRDFKSSFKKKKKESIRHLVPSYSFVFQQHCHILYVSEFKLKKQTMMFSPSASFQTLFQRLNNSTATQTVLHKNRQANPTSPSPQSKADVCDVAWNKCALCNKSMKFGGILHEQIQLCERL